MLSNALLTPERDSEGNVVYQLCAHRAVWACWSRQGGPEGAPQRDSSLRGRERPRPTHGLPPAQPLPLNRSCSPQPPLRPPAAWVLKRVSPGLCLCCARPGAHSLLAPWPRPTCSLQFRSEDHLLPEPAPRVQPAWLGTSSVPADAGLPGSRATAEPPAGSVCAQKGDASSPRERGPIPALVMVPAVGERPLS